MAHHGSNDHSHPNHHHGEEMAHEHHHHHHGEEHHDHHHGEEHHDHHHGEEKSHDHSHHHDHAHTQHTESEMTLSEKLALLMQHWIDHNNSHKDTYLSWADKAVDGKLSETADFLRKTAELSVKITENLENALKSIHK